MIYKPIYRKEYSNILTIEFIGLIALIYRNNTKYFSIRQTFLYKTTLYTDVLF